MADIIDIHLFLEANLPEYERKDILVIVKQVVEWMGGFTVKPYVQVLRNFQGFKDFICIEWQGVSEKPSAAATMKPILRCNCGGRMLKRRNQKEGNYFYGCSNYPRCRNTLQYE